MGTFRKARENTIPAVFSKAKPDIIYSRKTLASRKNTRNLEVIMSLIQKNEIFLHGFYKVLHLLE